MEPAPLYTDLAGVPDGGEAVFTTTQDGTRIRAGIWAGGSRTALVFPGRTEYVERYGHVIERLLARDFGVVVIDWRGQGLSDRHEGRTDRGYVGSFPDYQQDIAAVLALPQVQALTGPRTLFAHSMGGCIALRALSEGLEVERAVFSAPMWGLPHAAKYAPFLNMIDTLGKPLGIDTTIVPGATNEFYVLSAPFNGNVLTGNPEQYARMGDQLRAHPELGLGGATIHWAREAAQEMEKMRTVPLPDIPMQVFMGSKETVIDTEAVKSRIPTLPDARLDIIPNGRHELWMETPEIQDRVWQITDAFLATKNPA